MSRKQLLLVALVGILVFCTAFLLLTKHRKTPGPFTFTNLSSCSKGISDGLVDNLSTKMYSYIKLANDYNETPTATHYDGTFREESCVTTTDNGILTTTGIVDIASAKQSWKVSYNWTHGSKSNADLGALTASCVPTDQLSYGDFGCTQALSLQKYGTDEYDPILQYTPYTSPAFNIAYDTGSSQVNVTLLVPPEDINNTELINNDKEAVALWFTQHHLNISGYTVQYSVSQAAE